MRAPSVASTFLAAAAALALAAGGLVGCAGDSAEPEVESTSSSLTNNHIQWKMEPRAAKMRSKYFKPNGFETYVFPYTHPSQLNVLLSRTDAQIGDVYSWEVTELGPGGDVKTTGPVTTSAATVGVPRQGAYRVKSTRQRQGVTTSEETAIYVRDLVIAVLGDSMASGEGVPDEPGIYHFSGGEDLSTYTDVLSGDLPVTTVKAATWLDDSCHRSLRSGAALAVLKFEEEHPHLSVTFLDFACSGAEIDDFTGFPTGGGGGGGPDDPPTHPFKVGGKGTQLEALTRAVSASDGTVRPVDHLIMSVGINNLGFGNLADICATIPQSCVAEHLYDLKLESLAEDYAKLDQRIRALGFVKRVHLIEYPGESLLSVPPSGHPIGCGALNLVSGDEPDWLQDLGRRLVALGKQKARELDWDFIDGVDAAFAQRGYCAPDATRYFGQFLESVHQQGDLRGMVHPNYAGHVKMGEIIVKALADDEPEYTRSLAYVDVNRASLAATSQADVCARGPQGIWCAMSAGADFTAAPRMQTQFSDADGFGEARYHETVQFPDLNHDGKADVCGRGAEGIYCALSGSNGFGARTLWSGHYSDANQWGQAVVYSTIHFPDLNHDGKADVCGLWYDGVHCAISTGTSFAPATRWTTSFGDHNLFEEKYFRTLQYPDLNHDNNADLCMRIPEGVACALNNGGTGFGATTLWTTTFSNPAGWGFDKFYSTLGFPDLNADGKADVCARASWAVWCALSTGTTFAPSSEWSHGFTDGDGFGDRSSYSTLQYPDVNHDGRADLCGRAPDGIRCAVSDGATGFTDYKVWLAGFGDATGVQTARQFYGTIGFPDLDGDGAADFCGRGNVGMWCAVSDTTRFGALTLRDTSFSDKNGWLSGPR